MELITIQDPSTIVDRLPRTREELGDIEGLAKSIVEEGQIQPIIVTRTNEHYELVAGGRRRAACILAKKPILALLRETMTDLDLMVWELEENLRRKDLTWQEQSRGVAKLMELKQKALGTPTGGRESKGFSQGDAAEFLKTTQGRVSQQLKMAKAMEAFPELAAAETERDATKMLKQIEEKILLDELMRRRAAKPEEHPALFADTNFIIRDAFAGLRALPSGTFDFANTDTPYGVNLTEQKKIQTGVRTDADYTEWSRTEYLGLFTEVATQVYRLLKADAWAVFWYGQEWQQWVFDILNKAGFDVDKIPAVWYGGHARAQCMQPERNFARGYETFFLCRKGQPIMQKRGHVNVFVHDKLDPREKIHPTEKPLSLMKEIFECLIMPGSECLSPFLGSGVDLRAWYSLGCKGMGFELDQDLKNKFLMKVENDIKSGLYKGGAQ